jgi:hypothetical protein
MWEIDTSKFLSLARQKILTFQMLVGQKKRARENFVEREK